LISQSRGLGDVYKRQIDKSAQWLLCTGNEIVWVIGKRQDERFKTTLKTTNKLQITLEL
jgi:tRNA(Ile)-lysidine synthase